MYFSIKIIYIDKRQGFVQLLIYNLYIRSLVMSYQQQNKIIIENKEYSTLSGYLPHEDKKSNQDNNPNIKALTKEEWKKKYPNSKLGYIHSTGCYRRYVAKWEIKDNELYLVDLVGEYELINTNKLFADWFTGEVKIGIDSIIMEKKDINMPYGRYYSKIWTIVINQGLVTKEYIENK